MAFQLVQEFTFERVDYSYDRERDVLDISFGPPAPAIAIQVEDWLAIRMGVQPPVLQGMTIVGFKRVFEKVNPYVERELPERVQRLANVTVEVSYDDITDTLIMRFDEEPSGLDKKQSSYKRQTPSIFEPLSRRVTPTGPATRAVEDLSLHNVYLEKSLPSKELVGIKILEYTRCGPAALEGLFGAIIDTLFEPSAEYDENAHLITNALIERLDWQKVAALAASERLTTNRLAA